MSYNEDGENSRYPLHSISDVERDEMIAASSADTSIYSSFMNVTMMSYDDDGVASESQHHDEEVTNVDDDYASTQYPINPNLNYSYHNYNARRSGTRNSSGSDNTSRRRRLRRSSSLDSGTDSANSELSGNSEHSGRLIESASELSAFDLNFDDGGEEIDTTKRRRTSSAGSSVTSVNTEQSGRIIDQSPSEYSESDNDNEDDDVEQQRMVQNQLASSARSFSGDSSSANSRQSGHPRAASRRNKNLNNKAINKEQPQQQRQQKRRSQRRLQPRPPPPRPQPPRPQQQPEQTPYLKQPISRQSEPPPQQQQPQHATRIIPPASLDDQRGRSDPPDRLPPITGPDEPGRRSDPPDSVAYVSEEEEDFREETEAETNPLVNLRDDPDYSTYFQMRKMGMPIQAIDQAMNRDGVDKYFVDKKDGTKKHLFELDRNKPIQDQIQPNQGGGGRRAQARPRGRQSEWGEDEDGGEDDEAEGGEVSGDNVPLKNDPDYSTYFQMKRMGMPMAAITEAMTRDGVNRYFVDKKERIQKHVFEFDPNKPLKAQIQPKSQNDIPTATVTRAIPIDSAPYKAIGYSSRESWKDGRRSTRNKPSSSIRSSRDFSSSSSSSKPSPPGWDTPPVKKSFLNKKKSVVYPVATPVAESFRSTSRTVACSDTDSVLDVGKARAGTGKGFDNGKRNKEKKKKSKLTTFNKSLVVIAVVCLIFLMILLGAFYYMETKADAVEDVPLNVNVNYNDGEVETVQVIQPSNSDEDVVDEGDEEGNAGNTTTVLDGCVNDEAIRTGKMKIYFDGFERDLNETEKTYIQDLFVDIYNNKIFVGGCAGLHFREIFDAVIFAHRFSNSANPATRRRYRDLRQLDHQYHLEEEDHRRQEQQQRKTEELIKPLLTEWTIAVKCGLVFDLPACLDSEPLFTDNDGENMMAFTGFVDLFAREVKAASELGVFVQHGYTGSIIAETITDGSHPGLYREKVVAVSTGTQDGSYIANNIFNNHDSTSEPTSEPTSAPSEIPPSAAVPNENTNSSRMTDDSIVPPPVNNNTNSTGVVGTNMTEPSLQNLTNRKPS